MGMMTASTRTAMQPAITAAAKHARPRDATVFLRGRNIIAFICVGPNDANVGRRSRTVQALVLRVWSDHP
jgi:hypothetical protein